ncbi:hypothetical protein AB0C02_23495 [Micromonospora sp. NPDC048999]|uniref:hypothetical protein n=1 Tax=Micromonospora sp. NPDC048999 TaxID=3155391 RepID=UPI0033E21C59
MPEPQPGTDRPADGSTLATGREPGTDGSARTPVPPPAEPTGTPDTPTDEPETPAESPAVPARGSAPVPVPASPSGPAVAPPHPAGPDAAPARPSASAAVPGRPSGSAPVPGQGGPDPARAETSPQPPAPRWSGSAPVPPPPARKRSWGESAEPTPLPSEYMVPVDPWEGVDTTGWDLRSADFPALPPTLPYPPPAHTLPYPPPSAAPPPPAAATPVPPAPATPTPVPPPPFAPAPPVAARPAAAPPAPVSSPRTAPPAPVGPPEQRRQAPPATPTPPGLRPPKGYVAVPARRRRRWPWVVLLTVACCCGVPLWWAQPLRAQYPASATLPDQFAGLRLRQDERSQADAEQLKNEVRQAYRFADDAFAGIYTTSEGKRVTLLGGTGLRLTPEADADAEIVRLTDRYALGATEPVETGVRGRYERCAVGRADGDAVVVCTSVDHGSLVTGVFTWLDVNDSGRLLDHLRQQVVTK